MACALSAQAQLYRWTDESGKVHYTDAPPPASAASVETKKSVRTTGAAPAPLQSYALQQAVKSFPVTVYTSKDCGDPCKRGLAQLKQRGVPYAEKVVVNKSEVDELVKLAGSARVPVMTVGVVVQKDYDERSWNDALDSAGYPKAGTP